MNLDIQTGSPLEFGVTETADGLNFAVFCDQAMGLRILFFDLEDNPLATVDLSATQNRTGDVWHVKLQGLPEVFSYSYAVSPLATAPPELNEKIELLDPYAKVVHGLSQWGTPKTEALRAVHGPRKFDFGTDRPLNRPLQDSVIYELHVRGFTQDPSSGVQHPGTFEGIIEKIPYLKALGVTAVELMPINEFDETDCPFLDPETGERLRNYWGYGTLNFFSIKSSYGANQGPLGVLNSFKSMVKALHAAGIEVILDVVFNHTAEGGIGGEIYNFKGLSNDSYYMAGADEAYANYSGCGNTLNCNHPVVRNMILDALRYFVAECHVDGFRFDLASILSRDENGKVLANPPVLEIIAKDPVLANTKIIAEAWDAMGLYQVGSFPASGRWSEWNGRFRDCVRAFATGTKHRTAELATRIAGSEDLYKHSQRNPYHSINFITSHDGFTLMDLVSYQNKHNRRNGEQNRDGENHNYSQNFGTEGPTDQVKIQNLRLQQIRNFLTLLFISQGTPMILMGDEFGRSQQGNNNTWCQDNPTGWLDWGTLDQYPELHQYVTRLLEFRKLHKNLRRENFFTGVVNPATGLPDLSWHAQQAWEPEFEHGNNKIAFLIDGFVDSQKSDDFVYAAINFEQEEKTFALPKVHRDQQWVQILDTHQPASFLKGQTESVPDSPGEIRLAPLSIQLFTHP